MFQYNAQSEYYAANEETEMVGEQMNTTCLANTMIWRNEDGVATPTMNGIGWKRSRIIILILG